MDAKTRAEKIIKGQPLGTTLDEAVKFCAAQIEAALEENAIVTSPDGTSYCRFCEQQAKRVREAYAEAKYEGIKIAEGLTDKWHEAGYEDGIRYGWNAAKEKARGIVLEELGPMAFPKIAARIDKMTPDEGDA